MKYNTNAIISGHSLGGTIGGYIAGKDDEYYGLDAGYTFGQPTRGGENRHNFRTDGDVVSILGSHAKHMKTLDKKVGYNPFMNILDSHDVNNIKDEKIYID
jgi:hypothetical protein